MCTADAAEQARRDEAEKIARDAADAAAEPACREAVPIHTLVVVAAPRCCHRLLWRRLSIPFATVIPHTAFALVMRHRRVVLILTHLHTSNIAGK